jgi:hypothetical protein
LAKETEFDRGKMANPRMKVAELDPARLEKVRKLEAELGAYVVALEPEFRLAELTAEQVERLRAAERELGVVLLAYGSE